MAHWLSSCVACSAPVDWPLRFGRFLNGSPLADAVALHDHALVLPGALLVSAIVIALFVFRRDGSS